MEKFDYIELKSYPDSGNKADYVFIILHGLGASGNDFADIHQALKLKSNLKYKYILPNAPKQSVTVNGGMIMPAWYDVKTLDLDRKIDFISVDRSVDLIFQLIQTQLNQGYRSDQIIIGGFSQGGAMANEVARRFIIETHQSLAGIIILSAYLILPDKFIESDELKSLPIFMAHGDQDMIVPFSLGKKHSELLLANSFNITWKIYTMGHSVISEELSDIGRWINKC